MLAALQEACSEEDQRPAGWEESFKWVPGTNFEISEDSMGQEAAELSWSQ